MTLYITEKPSQVEALRNALKKQNIDKNIDIIPLAGHILALKDFKDYDLELDKYWSELIEKKLIPYFPESLEKKIKPNSSFIANGKKINVDYGKKFNLIKSKIDTCKQIILATDPDNEGATLGLEVVEMCKALDKVRGMINMSKLDLVSLSKEVEVVDKLPYMKMYYAGDSRAYFDQSFGFNLTIIATDRLGAGKTMHIGGVKLPILNMVTSRDEKFEAHKQIPYFTLKAIATKNMDEFDIEFVNSENDKKDTKFDKKTEVEKLLNIIKTNPQAKIISYKEEIKAKAPPKPYSLTDLQSDANKKYKYSADRVLKIAQTLYADKKVLSYPRTDCNYYAEAEYENANLILAQLANLEPLKKLVELVNLKKRLLKRETFNDEKITAHTALAPLNTDISNLREDEFNIYMLVAKRYIYQFMNDYEYLSINGIGKIKNIEFKFGENIAQSYKFDSDKQEIQTRKIPKLDRDDILNIDKPKISEGFSKPKPRFNESSLLKAMENISRLYEDEQIKKQLKDKGIGTPSTRANILEELKKRGYLKLIKNSLISTPKARELIRTLPDELSSPILRANMEENLSKILKGTLSKENYFSQVRELITKLSNDILKIDKKTTTKQSFIRLGKCPICKSSVIETGKVYRCEKNEFKNGKQTGCKFMIFKNFRNKDLTTKNIIDLLNLKKVILSLIAKSGNKYKIRLEIKDTKLISNFA